MCIYIRGSRVVFFGDGPTYWSYSALDITFTKLLIEQNSEVVFTGINLGGLFNIVGCYITISNSTMAITENSLTNGCDISHSHFYIINGSSLVATKNSAIDLKVSSGIFFLQCTLIMTPDSYISMTECDGTAIFYRFSNATLDGPVLIANNTFPHDGYGNMNIVGSTVDFLGTLEVVGNRAGSGAINAVDSELFFRNTAMFADNYGVNGGALALTSSYLHIAPNTTVEFTRNEAKLLGGAIYITKPRTVHICDSLTSTTVKCSIQGKLGNDLSVYYMYSITFNHNIAGIAGNAIYGGRTSACMPFTSKGICTLCSHPKHLELFYYVGVNDSSDLSDFTSDPTRVCFCENGIPDCYKVVSDITAYPGEHFELSVVTVGYGLGTVPGSVIAMGGVNGENVPQQSLLGSELEYSQDIKGRECQVIGYSVLSEREREEISLAVNYNWLEKPVKEVLSIVLQYSSSGSIIYPTLDSFFYIPVFVNVNLLPCPVGFQLVTGKCVCNQVLQNNNIHTCSILHGTAFILRPAPYWIGLYNDTNSSVLVHPHCPFDYCKSKDINISAESSDAQCQYQRSGVLCGSCREGLSMILGSSECKTCSNIYLVSIVIFIFVGFALVILITVTNMTVSVGTLNGLIFFRQHCARQSSNVPTNNFISQQCLNYNNELFYGVVKP